MTGGMIRRQDWMLAHLPSDQRAIFVRLIAEGAPE